MFGDPAATNPTAVASAVGKLGELRCVDEVHAVGLVAREYQDILAASGVAVSTTEAVNAVRVAATKEFHLLKREHDLDLREQALGCSSRQSLDDIRRALSPD